MSIEYLGTSQFTVDQNEKNSNACSAISLYMVQYLLYSCAPERASLISHFRYGAVLWRANRPEHEGACESQERAIKRYPEPRTTLIHDLDKDIIGMSVLKRTVPNPPSHIVYGVHAALEKLKEHVIGMPRHRGIGFCFTRGLYTIGGAIKSAGNNRSVSIDLIESHSVALPKKPPPPELPNGSAVWCRCDDTRTAADFIEALYPPQESDIELTKMLSTDPKKVPKAQAEIDEALDNELNDDSRALERAIERGHTPAGQFDFIVYTPRFDTPAKARRAIDHFDGVQ